MATVSVEIATGADDTNSRSTGVFSSGGTFITLGNVSSSNRHGSFRFVSTTIPQGATISAASVELEANTTSSSATVNLIAAFEDADGPAAPTSSADFDGRTLTATTHAWSAVSSWTAGTKYNTPDLTGSLQEVVNRASFGGTVQLFIKDDGSSADASRAAKSYELGAGNIPTLNATYTTGGAGQPTSKRFGGVPFTAQGGNVLGTVRRW